MKHQLRWLHSLRGATVALGLLLAGSPCLAGSVQDVPPVSLTVIDAASKQSLGGIPVHYLVVRKTRRTSTFGVLPPIEPLVERVIVSRTTSMTDTNGVVKFPGVLVQLRSHLFSVDEIELQEFFVNLEPSPDASRSLSGESENADRYTLLERSQPELTHVTTPDQAHKGFLLTMVKGLRVTHGREHVNVTVEFRPGEFERDGPRDLLVELKGSNAK